jgi:hypothetical protein
MKPKQSTANNSSLHDARIDAALRFYGRAVPSPGLESRVAARISAAPHHSFRSTSSRFPGLMLLRGFSIGALAAAAAVAIVVGTVRHSHQISIPLAAGATRSGGINSAGAMHIPTRATPQSTTIDPGAPRTPAHTRATISRNQASKPTGATVPRSPNLPDQPSSADPHQ